MPKGSGAARHTDDSPFDDGVISQSEAQMLAKRLCEAKERIEELETEKGQRNEVFHDDVLALLDALTLGTHARPESPHQVVHSEILPAIRRLRYREKRLEATVKILKRHAEDADRIHGIAGEALVAEAEDVLEGREAPYVEEFMDDARNRAEDGQS